MDAFLLPRSLQHLDLFGTFPSRTLSRVFTPSKSEAIGNPWASAAPARSIVLPSLQLLRLGLDERDPDSILKECSLY